MRLKRKIFCLLLISLFMTAASGCGGVSGTEDKEDNTMVITVNGTELTAVMEDNSSATGLMELLADGPLTIEMSDYANMEKVGSIGTNLPRNDKHITTGAGDLILYQGNSFVI